MAFGNHVSSEAVSGALPLGQNSPQKVPYGLYAEQLSGTAFTAPRAENRRSWLYRLRPTADHEAYTELVKPPLMRSGPFTDTPPSPNRLRWDPVPLPSVPTDFIDGLTTYAGNGNVAEGIGVGIHLYRANRSMERRAFVNSDGELLIVAQQGRLKIKTEFGMLNVAPLEIAVIPRGVKFSVDCPDGEARGYMVENYGQLLRLPELGPIGANGLANPRDFETPTASFEDQEDEFEIIQKFQGSFWRTRLSHSPFDVVAWHGNLTPYKYNLLNFNTINSVSFDHPDPSLFTVLTSPSSVPGTANLDFVIFPPRWMVAEHTFRPPWFHRNVMSEFMGLIEGSYDAKAGGFAPGGASLHNCMNGHGPDQASYEKAVNAELHPHKIDGSMAFMFESRWVLRPTTWSMTSPARQSDYDACWKGFKKANVLASDR